MPKEKKATRTQLCKNRKGNSLKLSKSFLCTKHNKYICIYKNVRATRQQLATLYMTREELLPTLTKLTNVFFRIEAGYEWGHGMTKDALQLFYKEITALFTQNGWTIQEDKIGCPSAVKGEEKLYLHPMDFSGNLSKESIHQVEHFLQEGKTYKLRCIDTYQTVYSISTDDYVKYLKENTEDIRKKILIAFTTDSPHQYKRDVESAISWSVEPYCFCRPGAEYSIDKPCSAAFHFACNIFKQLVQEGFILERKSRTGEKSYRRKNMTKNTDYNQIVMFQ